MSVEQELKKGKILTIAACISGTALSSSRMHHNLEMRSLGCEKKKKTVLSSSRKRARHQSRSQQVQRPSLDFEKMQQVRYNHRTLFKRGEIHNFFLSFTDENESCDQLEA